MRSLFFILGLFLSQQAFGFACEFYGDHNEITLRGEVQDLHVKQCSDHFDRMLDKPTIYFLTSVGGVIDEISRLANEFREEAELARARSGEISTVIIWEQCSSACLPVLASLNRLAADRKIRLIVMDNALLGFHGASKQQAGAPRKYYSRGGTARYLRYFREQGASSEWIHDHIQYFYSPLLTELHPDMDSMILEGSNLINHAVVVSSNKLYGRDLGKKGPDGSLDLNLVTNLFANQRFSER